MVIRNNNTGVWLQFVSMRPVRRGSKTQMRGERSFFDKLILRVKYNLIFPKSYILRVLLQLLHIIRGVVLTDKNE